MLIGTKNFSRDEAIVSRTAIRLGLDNTPQNPVITANIQKTLVYTQLLRDLFKCPIGVNSLFRCEALNKAIGGAKNSKHLEGKAVDIVVYNGKLNKENFFKIIEFAEEEKISPFDKIIWEPGWTHLEPLGTRLVLLKYFGENDYRVINV